jgi:hypothetical protein
MLWWGAKSSRVHGGSHESWVWTSPDGASVSPDMDDADAIDPDLISLIVQLCTRIGMIMEDEASVAIDASHERLASRIDELADAIRRMAAIADAAKALLEK